MKKSKHETMNLTKKQMLFYEILLNYYRENWKSPTISELCKITDKSKEPIWKMLRRLENKGYLEITRYKKRGIKLVLEEFLNDECISFCEDDIEKEKND